MTTTAARPAAPYSTTYTDGAGQTYTVANLLGGARLRIRQVAQENGWELVDETPMSSFEEYRKVSAKTGRTLTYIGISYSVKDVVVAASTAKSYIHGKGKADRVVQFLQSN